MKPHYWTRLAWLLWGILLAAVCIKPLFKPYSGTVYTTYRVAGEEFAAGRPLYNVPHPHSDNFRYPPAVAAGFIPFTWLPAGVGGAVWRLLGAGLFLGGAGAWARRIQPRLSMPLFFIGMLPLSIGSLSNGQANTHIAGLMLLGTALASRAHWSLAAALIAAATMVKGYPIALGGLLCLLALVRFGAAFAISLGIGCLLPYALQSPEYISAQYQLLLDNLNADDRTLLPLFAGYQDFHMLLRIVGIQLSRADYQWVQMGTGLAAAGLVVMLLRRGVDRAHLALATYTIGTAWMLVFGPTVEASTFILLAPIMALEILAARTIACRFLVFSGAGLFLLSVILFAFPHSIHRPVVSLGILPIAALLLSAGAILRILREIPHREHVMPIPQDALRSRAA